MPKGLKILRLAFKDTSLTHFGGMVILQRFCNKLGLRRLIQRSAQIPQRNADYLPSDLIIALLYTTLLHSKVHNHGTRPHLLYHLLSNEERGPLSRYQGRRDDNI